MPASPSGRVDCVVTAAWGWVWGWPRQVEGVGSVRSTSEKDWFTPDDCVMSDNIPWGRVKP